MFRMDEFIGISLQRLGDPREVARDPSQRNPGRSSPRTCSCSVPTPHFETWAATAH